MKLVFIIDVHEYHPLKDLPAPEIGEKAEVIMPGRHYFAAEYIGTADDKATIDRIRKAAL